MADETRADEPKKTETLEIRLSPELKEALRRTADAEGKSISHVLRSLIDRHLAQARRTQPRTILTEIVMFMRHPVRLLAAAVGGLAVALAGLTSGQAQDLSLALELEIWNRDQARAQGSDQSDEDIFRSREIATSITANFGETSTITVGEGTASSMVVDLTPEAVDAESYRLHVNLRELNDEAETVIASPVIIARFGVPALVNVGLGESGYRFNVLGEDIS